MLVLTPIISLTTGLLFTLTHALPSRSSAQIPLRPQGHSQQYRFDPLLHLPGTSPYFDAIGFGLEHKAPKDCKVNTASYLIRHGAIYANDEEYETYIKPLLFKIEKHRGEFSGPLEFLNTWQSPILEDKLEDLTPSGAVDAKSVGEHLLSLYSHLVPTARRILTDTKSRTYETAHNLIKAFPSHEKIEIVQIDKKKSINGSMEVIIPHKSCAAFDKSAGTKQMHAFLDIYASRVSNRLSPYTPPSYNLSSKDVLGLQSLCGYASGIDGERSQICDVFTDAEWMQYEYTWDMKYAYMVGPLNPLSPYLGFPWLQSQTELFAALDAGNDTGAGWPATQRFFLSFTHREVPPFVATALGIFNSSNDRYDQFPTDRVNWARAWRMSDLIPFLGHVGMEKMECDRPGFGKEEFVRFVANTAPRPLPNCQDGPGASCPFERFKEIIAAGAEKYKDFHAVCAQKKQPEH